MSVTTSTITDAKQRLQALDPAQSFLIQAPAGSGKTELLTQRLLRLLATVDHPEEILAMTFTRKAVAEMRARVLAALQSAQHDSEPEAAHQRQTWQLARSALQRDAEQGWQLLSHPARLRIRTIDGLNNYLVRQMPLLSGMGVPPEAIDDAQPLYQQAVRQTLDELERDSELTQPLTVILSHLGNNLAGLESLIIAMLKVREQWLRHLTSHSITSTEQPLGSLDRQALQQALAETVDAHIEQLHALIDADTATEWLAIARFGAKNLVAQGEQSNLSHCLHSHDLPGADGEACIRWQGLIELVLTKDYSKPKWRSSVNKTLGFIAAKDYPDKDAKAEGAEFKKRHKELITRLADIPGLQEALNLARQLPPSKFHEAQWQVLQALFQVLRMAAANLSLVIRDRGQADHSAISRAAIDALGNPQAPSDLALSLDYRLRHLLIDEFQDTSVSQWELLERLLAGWQAHDGHSLFIVGDPMQSIYRFRQAEVALFNQARDHGIAGLALTSLQLRTNFRSQAKLVDWVNQQFSNLYPAVSLEAGQIGGGDGAGIEYHPSTAFQAVNEQLEAVQLHGFIVDKGADQDDHHQQEAQRIVEIIQNSQSKNKAASIAILVRGRSHLNEIIPALQSANIAFQAIDIDPLSSRPFITDLLMLTRALLHLSDRIAWLALLRSPFCGLKLNELELIAGNDLAISVWDRLKNHQSDWRSLISASGLKRLQRCIKTLDSVLSQRGRMSLRNWVQQAWLAMGGPAILPSTGRAEEGSESPALRDIDRYFSLLDELSVAGDLEQLEDLEAAVVQLKAAAVSNQPSAVQIMTIHKAKGLEFDIVILPGLARSTSGHDKRLLYWHESLNAQGNTQLLLAPVKAHDQDTDATVSWIQQLEKQQSSAENGRVLYVATTRAKQQLHLFGSLSRDKEGDIKAPAKNTFLSLLWPQLELTWPKPSAAESQRVDECPDRHPQQLRRLSEHWLVPRPNEDIASASVETPSVDEIEYSWASEIARLVGHVIHELLEQLGRGQRDISSAADQAAMLSWARQRYRQNGLDGEAQTRAVDKTRRALQNLKADPRAHWVLDPKHQDSRCEWALTVARQEGIKTYVLDRSFIDVQGTRWIIDYKTGEHQGGGVEAFLESEKQRYQPQLENYAAILSEIEQRSIQLALYFPLVADLPETGQIRTGWKAWAYPSA